MIEALKLRSLRAMLAGWLLGAEVAWEQDGNGGARPVIR